MPQSDTQNLIANRYLPLSELGAGGMGTVFLVKDVLAKQPEPAQKALKFLPRDYTEEHLFNFKQEFALLSQLHHPNLVRVFDLGFDPTRKQFFFTQEYIDGIDIFAATNALPLPLLYPLLIQLADALGYIHRFGIVHNDLKPSNILICDSSVKVLDFGISTAAFDPPASSHRRIMGTPGYIAPELIQGQPATCSSDLYALGMVLLKVLARKLPFETKPLKEILRTTVEESTPHIDSFAKDFPKSLGDAIFSLTRPHPDQRPLNTRPLLVILENLAGKRQSRIEDSEKLPVFTSPLYGREIISSKILSLIESFFNPMPFGNPSGGHRPKPYLAISGVEGVGKSRVVSELLLRLQMKDIEVIRPDSQGAFQDQLKNILGHVQAITHLPIPVFLQESLEPRAAPNTADLPDLEDSLRFDFALGRYLKECAKIRKLLIALDPFPVEEGRAFGLLNSLERFCDNVFVLLTVRTGAIDQNPQVFSANDHIPLVPLLMEDTRKMISGLLGHVEVPEVVAKSIFKVSKGLPGKIESIVRSLIQSKFITFHKKQFAFGDAKYFKVSALDFDHLFRKNWRTFDATEQQILGCCCIFITDFLPRVIAIITQQPLIKVFATLEKATEKGFLRSGLKGAFFWSRTFFRDKIYEHFGSPGKEQKRFLCWHATLARWMESQPVLSLRENEIIFHHHQKAKANSEAIRWAIQIIQRAMAVRNLSTAEKYLRFAQQQLRFLGSQQRFYILSTMAQILLAEGRLEEAEVFLANALKDSTLDIDQKTELTIHYSGLQRNRGNPQESIAISTKALRETHNPTLKARLLAQIGVAHINEGEMALALEFIDRALALGEDHAEPNLLANLLNRKGLILFSDSGKTALAKESFEKALALFEKINFHSGKALTLHNISLCVVNLEEKENLLKKALSFAQKGHDLKRIFHCLKSLGALKTQQGNFFEATTFLNEALDFANILDDPQRQIDITLTLAFINLQSGHYVSAYHQIEQCADRSKKDKWPKEFLLGKLVFFQFFLQMGDLTEMNALETEILTLLRNPAVVNYSKMFKKLQIEKQILFEPTLLTQESLNYFEGDLEQYYFSLLAHRHQQWPLSKTLEDTEKALDIFEGHTDFFVWIETFLLWADLTLQNGCTPILTNNIHQRLSRYEAFYSDSPEIKINVDYLLAKMETATNDNDNIFQQFNKIREGFNHLKSFIPPQYTSLFLNHPKRDFILNFVTTNLAQHNYLMQEIAVTRRDNENLRAALETLEAIDNTSDEKSILDEILSYFMTQSQSTHGLFFYFKKGTLSRPYARTVKGVDPDFPKELTTYLEENHEDIFLKGRLVLKANFSIMPIYRQDQISKNDLAEKIPFGFFAWNGRQAAQTYRYFALIAQSIVRFQKERVLEQQLDTTSKDLKMIRSTMTVPLMTQPLQYSYIKIIGTKSQGMKDVLYFLDRIIPSTISVLILGESGTGKELIAQTIHTQGPLAGKPFVAINCGSLEPNLVESILFGHKKGAFTGATDDKMGLLEQADGGTLFLDEIGELQLDLQAKLLRALETGEIRALGSDEVKHVKFRVIAATHRAIPEQVRNGLFREDLFYRLNGLTLELPALRDRREDIPILIDFFLTNASKENQKSKKYFSAQALKKMVFFNWPGNVRQLKNIVEMLLLFTSKRRIEVDDLPPEIRGTGLEVSTVKTFSAAKKEFTKHYLESLLNGVDGNVSEAAKKSGLRREYLHTLIKKELKN